jgi:hypothetical protein
VTRPRRRARPATAGLRATQTPVSGAPLFEPDLARAHVADRDSATACVIAFINPMTVLQPSAYGQTADIQGARTSARSRFDLVGHQARARRSCKSE